mmetsp:Transcript_12293/g.25921  ORF Transcript_12293/g.25921 Transcript_12293/m.25921 type:complete len:99 (-) Transcript_12293:105-401(-)
MEKETETSHSHTGKHLRDARYRISGFTTSTSFRDSYSSQFNNPNNSLSLLEVMDGWIHLFALSIPSKTLHDCRLVQLQEYAWIIVLQSFKREECYSAV